MRKLYLFCADCCIRVTALLEYLDLKSWGALAPLLPSATYICGLKILGFWDCTFVRIVSGILWIKYQILYVAGSSTI